MPGVDLLDKYNRALYAAIEMLNASNDSLGIRSALKQAASDEGIAFGDDMGKFVEWAEQQLALYGE